jgi:hypothetical protein
MFFGVSYVLEIDDAPGVRYGAFNPKPILDSLGWRVTLHFDHSFVLVNLGQLDSRPDDRLHGGSQQPVLSREAQGARVPDGGINDQHALLRCREAHPAVLLTH